MQCARATLLSPLRFAFLGLLVSCTIGLFSTASFAAQNRIVGPAVSRQAVRLSTGVPAKARVEFDRGPVDPALKINYMTLLTVPSANQQKALDHLLAQQQDPRSRQYHRWITPEQFADQFGLSVSDLQKLTAWLRSQGFTVNNVARGRNWIAFSGTASQVAMAFQTKLHKFEVNGESHFANISSPSIPSSFAAVVSGVRGLSDFRSKSHLVRQKPAYTLPVTAGNELFLAPGDVTTIYDIQPLYSAGIDGTGEQLAVVGRTDVYLADLNAFRAGFNLPSINCTADANGLITTSCNTSNFRYVLHGPDPGVNPFSPNDDLPEADLDLEWSGATAPNAQIIYVNSGGTAGDVFDAYYYAIDNKLAPVITMSYGFCELDEARSGFTSADETELKLANSEGITFMNSSGDVGAAGCDNSPPTNFRPYPGANLGLAVSYPASSPEVTGVGGTMIPIGEYSSTFWNPTNDGNGGSAVSYIPETAWNDISEIGAFCASNAANPNCHPSGSGNVPVTNAQTAQEDFWLSGTGGGVSGCTAVDTNNVCSGGFAKPSYQTVAIPNQTAGRFVPDVSLMASANFPGYIVCTPQFELVGGNTKTSSCAAGIPTALKSYFSVYGGTSVSTPIFAGIVTLLDQYLKIDNPGLGNINPTLYSLAKTTPSAFHQATAALNAPADNVAYCQPGTPSNQPVALQCPAGGTMGYFSSNSDASTGYNLVTGLGSVDVNNLAIAWAAARSVTSITIQASPTTVIFTRNVTLTAHVTPTAANNTVNFYLNGSSTPLASVTPTNGVATFSTTTLPIGSNSITAAYAGDGYNAPSTSVTPAVVSVIAPDFALANTGTSSATVLAGISATGYAFTVASTTPAGTFATDVTFACSGIDTTSSCVFTPASIAAGTAGTQTINLTITTAGPNQASGGIVHRQRADNRSPWLPFTLPLAGVVVVGLLGRRVPRSSATGTWVMLMLLMMMLAILIACGGSSKPPVSVAVSPASVSLWPNNAGWPSSTQAFTANVGNTNNTAVSWSISPASAGSIDAGGNYTAPTVAAGLPATATITATSQADSSKTATGFVTLKKPTIPGTYSAIVTVTEATTVHNAGPYTLIVQ